MLKARIEQIPTRGKQVSGSLLGFQFPFSSYFLCWWWAALAHPLTPWKPTVCVSSHPHVQWPPVGSLKWAPEGAFTPWKLTNANDRDPQEIRKHRPTCLWVPLVPFSDQYVYHLLLGTHKRLFPLLPPSHSECWPLRMPTLDSEYLMDILIFLSSSIKIYLPRVPFLWSSLVAQTVKNLPAMQETQIWSWLGRFPGEGNGYPLQYYCLENSLPGESPGQRSLVGYCCVLGGLWFPSYKALPLHGINRLLLLGVTLKNTTKTFWVFWSQTNPSPGWRQWEVSSALRYTSVSSESTCVYPWPWTTQPKAH